MMQFEPNEDQSAFLSVLEQMMASGAAQWKHSPQWQRYDVSDSFDATLEEAGFFDCAAEETLGSVAATLMIYRLASLPVAVECAASSLLRPVYLPDLPRPIAVIEDDAGAVTRFLPVAKSVLLLSGDAVRAAILKDGAVHPVESLFAYPMGKLIDDGLDWQPVDADPGAVRDRWRVAIAAEIAGALKGALASVRDHVCDRQQFGRPLGSFQAIQHRLAEAATKVDAAHWLALKAAETFDPVAVATALGYAQDIATEIVYDLHQFMGAMGITLEHPLHRWSYRVRLLKSSLGGAHGNLQLASQRRWGNDD